MEKTTIFKSKKSSVDKLSGFLSNTKFSLNHLFPFFLSDETPIPDQRSAFLPGVLHHISCFLSDEKSTLDQLSGFLGALYQVLSISATQPAGRRGHLGQQHKRHSWRVLKVRCYRPRQAVLPHVHVHVVVCSGKGGSGGGGGGGGEAKRREVRYGRRVGWSNRPLTQNVGGGPCGRWPMRERERYVEIEIEIGRYRDR